MLVLLVVLVALVVGVLILGRSSNLKLLAPLELYARMRATISEYPLAIACSFVSGAILLYLVLKEPTDKALIENLIRVAVTGCLGIPLFTAMRIWKSFSRTTVGLEVVIGAAVLGTFYFLGLHNTGEQFAYRTVQWGLAALLLIACAPAQASTDSVGLWRYNREGFTAALFGATCAVVLGVGFCVALGATSYLFELKLEGRPYFSTWLISVFFIQTLIILSRFPKKLSSNETSSSVFTASDVIIQYLGLPFVTLYLLILYAYGIEIGITGSLPKGMVGWLVSTFSVVGTFVWLVCYGELTGELRFAKIYRRWFFPIVLPLLALLFVGVYERVCTYGFTEQRYFLTLLGVWLTIVSLYFTFIRSPKLIVVPLSLAILSVGSSFGPWSAGAVSVRSQLTRLEMLLRESHIEFPFQVKVASETLDSKKEYEVSNIVKYLLDVHGPRVLERAFANIPESEAALREANASQTLFQEDSSLATKILTPVGVTYRAWLNSSDEGYFAFSEAGRSARDISPVRITAETFYYPNMSFYYQESAKTEISAWGRKFDLKLIGTSLVFLENDTEKLNYSLVSFTENLRTKYPSSYQGVTNSEDLSFVVLLDEFQFRFQVSNMSGYRKGLEISRIQDMRTDIFVSQVMSRDRTNLATP